MWHSLVFLPLAFALSMDSFGVGTTYGMRRIRLPMLPTAVIAGCSAIAFFLSMQVSGWLTNGISLRITTWIGAIILILLGSWALFQALWKETFVTNDSKGVAEVVHVYRFELKHLGLIIEILRSPTMADMDKSGSISPGEAFFLGAALSLDSLGAGMAAVTIGLPPMCCAAIIGIMSGIFIRAGMWFGFRYAENKWKAAFTYLPGIILICIGIIRIL